jgi:hypothetical protein
MISLPIVWNRTLAVPMSPGQPRHSRRQRVVVSLRNWSLWMVRCLAETRFAGRRGNLDGEKARIAETKQER